MSQFKKRKIAELLETFTKPERLKFKKYLKVNGGKIILAFWEAIQSSHPKYNISDETIFSKIRPKQKFDDSTFRGWVTKLAQLAKRFIAIQEFEEDAFLYNNKLTLALLKRRVKEMGEKYLEVHQKQLEKKTKKDTYFYDHCFHHNDIAYQYVAMLEQLTLTESLQKATDYLDYSYLVKKLKFLAAMYNRQRIIQEEYVFRLEAQIMEYLDENPMQEFPLIYLYYLMLRMSRDLNDHESFDFFIAFFYDQLHKIDDVEARQLIVGANNFCLWNIQLGNLRFLSPRMELIKTMVERGFLLVEKKLSPYHFSSIVNIAIEVGELDWASWFIDKSLPQIEEKHRDAQEAFNHAYLHFAKEEYEAQSRWMLCMENKDFLFKDDNDKMALWVLKLKTAYTKLNRESSPITKKAFQSQLGTFRSFLSRSNQLSENASVSANNFQKALHQLHQEKQGETLRVGHLPSYIASLKPIRDLPWLLSELEKLHLYKI